MLAAARSATHAMFALVDADALVAADAVVYTGNVGVFNVDRYGFRVCAVLGGLRGP